jgi:dipeptidyl aminopeptidase/acylaminoacyl peptidase
MKRGLLANSFVIIGLISTASQTASAQKRVLTPDDLFRLETIAAVSISPDGEFVAYEVQRPIATASTFGRERMWGNDRGDVCVASVTGKSRENITNGSADHSGFWAPVWSPNGNWLAMLSSRGGNVRVWVWEKSSRRLRMLSERGVNPWTYSFTWASNNRLVYAVLAKDQESPALALDAMARQSATNEWNKQRDGQETTASALESGIPTSLQGRPEQELRITDVSTGETQVASRAIGFSTVRVSPDRHAIAFLEQIGVWHPTSEHQVRELDTEIYQTAIVNLQSSSTVRVMKGVTGVFAGSIEWSPDGRELAMVAYDKSSARREQVFRCDVPRETCKPATDRALNLNLFARNQIRTPSYFWYGQNNLMIHGDPTDAGETSNERREQRWWSIDTHDHLRDFFAGLRSSQGTPNEVRRDPGRSGVVALIEGKVWRISEDGALVQNFIRDPKMRITSIARPSLSENPDGANLILDSRHGGQTEYYLLNLATSEILSLRKPSSGAQLAAFDGYETFVFSANDSTGSYLWLMRSAHDEFESLAQTNRFLCQIESGKLFHVEYRSLEGEDLKAWAILPPGYAEGKRYPVIVWVYAGETYGDEEPLLSAINNSHPLNLQLLAAHGYVVLMPSMPLEPYGKEGEPYFELMNGVLPALNKLIESGIADPNRVGVMGHSYGGYSVYGLITQTKRFKAAAALAGFSDLMSMYGEFDPTQRYTPFAHEDSFRMWQSETLFMGGPVWKDEQKYIRNSPISYVERVATPVLIIQGDLDFVPLQQGEEFFTALYRQNKRAEFVRYWGEDHILNSPANIKDMWHRLYAWFDQFLQTRDAAVSN